MHKCTFIKLIFDPRNSREINILNVMYFLGWLRFPFTPTLDCDGHLSQVSNAYMIQFMASHAQINADNWRF